MDTLTEDQITGRLTAVADERAGYERRLAGSIENGDRELEQKMRARLGDVDELDAWLRSQSNAPKPAEPAPAPAEREKPAPDKQTRPAGPGRQTRTAGKSSRKKPAASEPEA